MKIGDIEKIFGFNNGGVFTFQKKLPQHLVDVNSPLPMIAVRVTVHTWVPFSNIYIFLPAVHFVSVTLQI